MAAFHGNKPFRSVDFSEGAEETHGRRPRLTVFSIKRFLLMLRQVQVSSPIFKGDFRPFKLLPRLFNRRGGVKTHLRGQQVYLVAGGI